MKLYVPENLKKLELYDQLCRMIKAYGDGGYYTDPTESIDDYSGFYLRVDPVKRFVEMTLGRENLSDNVDWSGIVSYVTSLFYSVKGTPHVFSLMKKYLDIDIGSVEYDGIILKFFINSVTTSDEGHYLNCLRSFLGSLLFFNPDRSKIEIGTVKLKIIDSINSSLMSGVKNYLEYIIKDES